MRIVSADDISRVLTHAALVDALHDAFRADIEVPPRHVHMIPQPSGSEAKLLLMPAWTNSGERLTGCKVVSVYPDNAKLIQVDIDPFELGRNWEPDVAIQADARQAVVALAQALQERGVTANEEYVGEITSGRRDAIAAAAADAEGALEQGDMPLKGKSIVHEINRVFGDNTILVKENGGQDLW